MRRRAAAGCSLLALLFTFALGASARAQSGELSFVEPVKIAATSSDGKSDQVSVWLKNTGAEQVSPGISAILEDGDGESVAAKVTVLGADGKPGSPAALGAGQVGRYRIYISTPGKSSGQLVATAPGLAPASLPVSLGPELSSARGVDGALLWPALGAALLLLPAWLFGRRGAKLTDKLGGAAELDFSKSFASTLTAVGALLGTIIAATGVLPEETVNLSKAGFTGLNLTFGIAIVIAAAISGSFLSSKPKLGKDGKKEWEVEGYVLPFLIATLITLWAVFGELATIWLLIEELGFEKGFTSLGVTMLQVLLVLGALAMIPYTFVKLKVAVAEPKPKPPRARMARKGKPIAPKAAAKKKPPAAGEPPPGVEFEPDESGPEFEFEPATPQQTITLI